MTEELMIKESVEVTEFKQTDLLEVQDIFDVNDNLKGVTNRIPQIKINHQACLFTNPDKTLKEESFKGIILHHSPVYAYWIDPFASTDVGTPPNCFSMNGHSPTSSNPQSGLCYKCKHNQFGSSSQGNKKGKACKNMWRLHILVEDQQIPKRLTVPPSNLGVLQDFLVHLRDINVPHELAVVHFSLEPAKSKGGIEYSTLKLRLASVINNREKALDLKKIKQNFSGSFQDTIETEEKQSEVPF